MDEHDSRKTAVLFPGQGSQEPGMGRDVAEHWSEAMDLWRTAEAVSGIPLREIYWDNDEQAMAETRNLQPALTVVNLGLWGLFRSQAKAHYLAGHSLGEYSALIAAQVLDPRKGLELVALRGRLMSEAGSHQPGTMAAIVKLDQDQVEDLVRQSREETGQELVIANYNSPAQYVISGTEETVGAASRLAKEAKGRAIPLSVSAAFHSPLMSEAARELASAMHKVDWRDARIPVHLNLSAKPEVAARRIQTAMARQMTSSVLWSQTMRDQWEQGVRTWYEVGPKGVLTKLLKMNLADKDEPFDVARVSSLEQLDQLKSLPGSASVTTEAS